MEWLRALLTVLGGSMAGGITNRVAIWMLFHPYEPPELFGRRIGWLQGAVPKNRERMARSIGDAVGGRLLTAEDLADVFRGESLRAAFHDRLERVLRGALRGDHPPPAELLSPGALEELRGMAASALVGLTPRIAEGLESRAFAEQLEAVRDDVAVALAEDDEVGSEAVHAARERIDAWLERLARSDAFRRAVRGELQRVADELLQPGRSLEEVLPPGAVGALEDLVGRYLPLAMERLGRLLEDPAARERFQQAVDDLLDRFMEDLRFHQRVVARLVITEETVDRVVDTLEEEGTERLGELLREQEVQDAMARSVSDAVQELLRRPARDLLGAPDGPRVREGLDAVTDWLVSAAASPTARRYLLDRLEDAAWRAEGAAWADLLRRVPADRLGGWLARLLRTEAGEAAVVSIAGRAAGALLERPLGAVGPALGDGAARRLSDVLAPPLWEWLSGELPAVADRIPVARKVEEKILEFPMEEVEALVRSVTQRELDLIVRLGYLLGAIIGGLLVAATALTP